MSQEKRQTTRSTDVVNRPSPDYRHGHMDWQDSPYAPRKKPNRAKRAKNGDATIWMTLGAALTVGIVLAAQSMPSFAPLRHLASAQIGNIAGSVRGLIGDGGTERPQPVPIASAAPAPTAPPLASSVDLPSGSVAIANPGATLTIASYTTKYCPFRLVMGGVAGSMRSPLREGVEDFVRQAKAVAGLNGTFFANASLDGTDNLLIGPSLCGGETALVNSPFDNRPELTGRPMVLMSPTQIDLIPYQYGVESVDSQLREFLPNMTDAFLGGVWLVHNGVAATPADVASFSVHDAQDPRRRAFFAIMSDGRPALGATTYVASSSQLAAGLQSIGVREAVLLDSGFSTSLVFQNKILVTGHTAIGVPSRPVPHALLLFGTPDPEAVQLAQALPTSIARGFLNAGPSEAYSHRRRHRLIS